MEFTIHNTHLHVFNQNAVPRNFLKLGLVRLLAKSSITKPVGRLLNRLNPWSSDDVYERYSRFMQLSAKKSSSEIFDFVSSFYPAGSRFVLLSMDMAAMGAGEVPQPFEKQIEELAQLKRDLGDTVLPFVAVDPRRTDIFDIVKKCFEEDGFAGVKIYPPLGYLPYDAGLTKIYDYCVKYGKPVISHVSHGPVYYRGDIDDGMISKSRINKDIFRSLYKDNPWSYFTHPLHYEVLANDFPTLRIDMAHFGGEDEWKLYLNDSWHLNDPNPELERQSWFSIILKLIKKYPNLYTDVAYTLCDPAYQPLLHTVLQDRLARDKILFGSDYYMVQTDASERAFALDLRAALGEADFKRIAATNPKRFLFS